jgi:hypothetical protein
MKNIDYQKPIETVGGESAKLLHILNGDSHRFLVLITRIGGTERVQAFDSTGRPFSSSVVGVRNVAEKITIERKLAIFRRKSTGEIRIQTFGEASKCPSLADCWLMERRDIFEFLGTRKVVIEHTVGERFEENTAPPRRSKWVSTPDTSNVWDTTSWCQCKGPEDAKRR